MPEISVVMPVYNSEKTLRRAVDSILNQIFTNFELIIVNDFGSNDDSRKIIDEYAANDSRVKLLQLKERAGIAKSLNIGIQNSEGKYIARMDADDYSYPERLAKQYEFMSKNPNVAICGTAFNVVDAQGNKHIHAPFFTDDKDLRARLLFGCVFCHPTVMMKRQLFFAEGLSYNEKIVAEDFELWTQIDHPMANLPTVLFDYYYTDNNTSVRRIYEDRLQACATMRKQLMRRLHVNTDDCKRHIINPDFYDDDIDIANSIIKCYELLLRIENTNNQLQIYDRQALASAESDRWNKFLQTFAIYTADDGLNIPQVTNETEMLFSESLAQKLDTTSNCITAEIQRRISMLYDRCKPDAKVIVFGTGRAAKHFFSQNVEYLKKVSCFCDNNPKLWHNKFYEKDILPTQELLEQNYDWILISTPLYWDEIVRLLVTLNVERRKIAPLKMIKIIP